MSLDDFPSGAELESEPHHSAEPREHSVAGEESEDLFDFPVIVAFAEDQRSAHAWPQYDPAMLEAEDPDALVDEGERDDFGSLDRSLDRATDSVSGMLSGDLPVPATVASSYAARASAPVETRSAAGAKSDLEAQRVPPAPILVSDRGSLRPVWILAAAGLLLNLALVTVLWQVSSAVRDTLLEVRAERTLASAAAPLAVEPRAADTGPRLPAASATTPLRQEPAPFEVPEDLLLRLAREELDAGQYAAARRRLFGLLARIDAVDSVRRRQLEVSAAFLVAETFRAQAQASAEVGS